jgi:cytochrome P450/NADPH-cytochrome P450 reductase
LDTTDSFYYIKWDAIISLEGSSLTLPTNISTYARTVLSDFVELGQPVTKKGIHRLAESTKSEDDANEVKRLAEPETYSAEIAEKRISMLDLLEKYPSIDLELGTFLSLLPPLRVRQ